jgi:hypothetical protein
MMAAHRATMDSETAWIQVRFPLTDVATRWVGIVTTVFVRFGGEGGLLGSSSAPAIVAMRVGLSLAVLGLVVICAREIVRVRALRPAAVFSGLLALIPAAALVVPDLAWGGRRSMVPRYTVPIWIALELCVAAGVVVAIRRSTRPRWLLGALAVLILAGAMSSWNASRMRTWWDTNFEDLRAIEAASARIDEGSTVLSDVDPMRLLVFARTLKDGVILRLFTAGSEVGGLPPSPVFLFSPSAGLAEAVARARPGWRRCVQGGQVELWCEAR